MKSCGLLLSALALMASPVFAQDWQSSVRQDIYVAYGGSDENGWMRFECPDPASGLAGAGELSISLTLKEGVALSKKRVPDEITFWISDGKSFLLPMKLLPGTDNELRYDHDPEWAETARDMLEAARVDNRAGAYADDELILSITLDGSAAALREVAACSR